MNEKIAKKIGEAHAFAALCKETNEQVPAVFAKVFGEAIVSDLPQMCSTQMDDLERTATEAGMADAVLEKSKRTQEKIRTMANQYVGDAWDDPAEVLEWMSFFVGGAAVHWDVIAGGGSGMQHDDLKRVGEQGAAYYTSLFEAARSAGNAIGVERAG